MEFTLDEQKALAPYFTYERVFNEYGDDSVAQLGSVHLACERASNILAAVLGTSGRAIARCGPGTYSDFSISKTCCLRSWRQREGGMWNAPRTT